MKSPIQSKPVERNSITAQGRKTGVTQSDCCGSGKCCEVPSCGGSAVPASACQISANADTEQTEE